jgi:hypothetical protein
MAASRLLAVARCFDGTAIAKDSIDAEPNCVRNKVINRFDQIKEYKQWATMIKNLTW